MLLAQQSNAIPPRLIPVLLVDRQRRVVKTVRFGERTYVGDPFNIVRIFNEKEVDEICILDIDATSDGRLPDMDFAAAIASECFMPLSFGGGVSTLKQAGKLIELGIEKVLLRTHTTELLIGQIAQRFGSQAVIGCIDYHEDMFGRFVGPSREPLSDAAKRLASAGVGELVLQSIDRDGTRRGMDLKGIASISSQLPIPIIAIGGAGNVDHLYTAISAGADAAASGSTFCFIGQLRAVLLTYPEYAERQKLAFGLSR